MRTSEEKFRRLFETAQDGIILLEARTGKITDINPFIEKLLGYSHQELLGKKLWEIGPFQYAFTSQDAFRELQRKGYIRYEDLPLETKDGHRRDVEFVSNVYQVGDRKVIQCNVRDITERKRIELVLKASEDRSRRAFDEGPVGMALADKQYHFLQANPAFCRMLGYTEQEIKKLTFKDITHPADLKASIENVQDLEKGTLSVYKTEKRYLTKKKDVIWGALTLSTVHDQGIEFQSFLVMIEDITQRKQGEEKILASEARYRRLFEAARDGILILDARTGVIEDVNPYLLEMLGFSLEQLRGEKIWELGFFKDIAANRAKFLKLQDKEYIRYDNLPLETAGGRRLDVEFVSNVYRVDGRKVIQCNIRDITERVHAVQALHESEERFRSIFENTTIGLYRTTPEGRILLANPTLVRMLGCETFEDLSRRDLEKFGFDSQHPREMFRQQVESKGEVIGLEAAWKRKDGTTITVRESARAIRDTDGRVLYYEGTVEDITERKHAEDSLRESEERYRSLFEDSPISLWEEDFSAVKLFIEDLRRQGVTDYGVYFDSHPEQVARCIEQIKVVDVNQAALKLFGARSKVEIRNNLSLMIPEEAHEDFREELINIAEGKSAFEWQGINHTLAGERRAVVMRWSVAVGHEDKLDKVILSVEDVTERKRAEQALEEERNLLRTMIDNLPDRIYVMDTQGRKTVSNHADWKACGVTRMEDVLGKTDLDIYPADLAAEFWALDKAVIDSGRPVINHEERGLDSQGKPVLVLSTKVPLRNAQGKVIGLVGIGRDVTERKRTEEQIRVLSKLPDESPNPIMRARQDGILLYANRTSGLLLDLWKTRVGLNLPDEWREKIKKVFDSGLFQEFEVNCSEKDFSFILAPVVEAGYVNLYGRDITQRKQAEETLVQRTAELRQRNEELSSLYRASGSLLSSTPFDPRALARTIVEIVLQEFGLANCSVFTSRPDSTELDRLAVGGPYADVVSKILLTLDGDGQVQQAIRFGRIINTPDVRASSAQPPRWDMARSELTLPLKIEDRVIGAIDIQSTEPDSFKPNDERLMSIFAERAALAIERGRLNEQLERRFQQLTSLRTIDMAISGSMDLNLSMGVLLDQVIQTLDVEAADVLIFNPLTQSFRYLTGRGFHTHALQYTDLRLGDGYAGQVALTRQILSVRELPQGRGGLERSVDFHREGFVSYVGAPLIVKGQVRGVLEIFQRNPFDLNLEQRAFLEMLAGQAAIAIDSAQLFENLESSNSELMMAYEETIEGWSRAMDLRDKETEGHTQRVTELTLRLANSLGVKPGELVHLRRGALLHDIGKMGVPDNILRKPGPLTDEEWVIMHRHPQLAYDMLAPILYLRPAVDIPWCHHEKWDGTGYPRGLKGQEIPLAARIFAVVDVWDALCSDRPYRKAWPVDKVRSYIQEQAGKYFDPRIVESFLREVSHIE